MPWVTPVLTALSLACLPAPWDDSGRRFVIAPYLPLPASLIRSDFLLKIQILPLSSSDMVVPS